MPQYSLLNVVGNEVLQRKCNSCPLSDIPQLKSNCMGGEGVEDATFMFVGRAPGKEDDGIGRPMTGKNGRLFYQLLEAAGIRNNEVYVTNALKCAPYDVKVKDKFWLACKGHFKDELKRVRPKAIISVGAEALTWLTGVSGVKKFRRHGIPCSFAPEYTVFPIGQPAQLFHVSGDSSYKRLWDELVGDLSWLKQKAHSGDLQVSQEEVVDYQVARTVEDVYRFLEELDKYEEISTDLETGKKDFTKGHLFPDSEGLPVAIGFSGAPGMARAIPLYALGTVTYHYWEDDELENKIMPAIRAFLLKKKIYGQNFVQFDQKWIRVWFGIDRCNITFDTMYAHYLIDEQKGSHDLEQMAALYAGMLPWKKLFNVRDIEKLCKYLCKDVDAACRLRYKLAEMLTPKQWWLLTELMIPLGHELMEMEFHGVKLDPQAVDALELFLNQKINEAVDAIRSMPEVKAFELERNTRFEPTKAAQVADVLENYLKLTGIQKTSGGRFSTNAAVLESLEHLPFVANVLHARGLLKLKGTYCLGMKIRVGEDGRIHTSYLQHGTETGRPSSQDPNLMNLPREETTGQYIEDGNVIKKMFVVEEGEVMVYLDLSQAELRTLAMYSKDPNLVQAYLNDEDIHQSTAAKVYDVPLSEVTAEQRNNAKPVNFGIIYGRSQDTVATQMAFAARKNKKYAGWTDGQFSAYGVNTARQFYQRHRELYGLVWHWLEMQEDIIREFGYQETFFGRRRHYEEVTNHAIRQGMNFPIQSTASDFTLISLARTAKIFRRLEIPAYPMITVYDSIGWRTKIEYMWEVARVAKHVMETLNFDFMNVPLKADVAAGFSWGILKKIDPEKELVLGGAH